MKPQETEVVIGEESKCHRKHLLYCPLEAGVGLAVLFLWDVTSHESDPLWSSGGGGV